MTDLIFSCLAADQKDTEKIIEVEHQYDTDKIIEVEPSKPLISNSSIVRDHDCIQENVQSLEQRLDIIDISQEKETSEEKTFDAN